jgi:cellobiose-specific phosphotransferase system component IIA
MHTAKKEFKEATEQFTNALKCRIKSFELYENERHPETLELYLLLTEVHLAQDNIKEAVKYHQLAKNLIVRFRQISNIEYHIFFLKHLNLEIELTLKLKDPLSNLIYTVGYYNSFLKYAKENNISDQHPVMIKSKSLIDSLLSNANFCIFLQQSKQSVSASNDSKFPTSLSAASDTVAFFKRIAISPNTLSTRDEQFKFERHEVAGDGECGYTAFGITRKDVYDLIKSNLIDVQDLLLPVVKEAVLSERFINYLKEKGVANAALLAEYNKYKAAAEQGGNMSNSIIDNLYQKIDLIVIQGYIDYDIRDTKVDAGWSHPRILQVLAYLQKIKLYMWQLSDGKLIPHRQEEYAVYTPPTTVESRIDLLFINNNHFDRLELQSNLAAEMNKDQPFKPDVIMP